MGGMDWRDLSAGRPIPASSYCDQPYVVLNRDGSWLCVITTGSGAEGDAGQHVVSMVSRDQGLTWDEPVAVESPEGPEASWALPLATPSGRIYVFYTYNTDNLREIPNVDGTPQKRVDSLGDFAYRFSDDGGRSWSAKRYRIPMRVFRIDRANSTGGQVLFHWGVGKPFLHDGKAYLGYSKVGGFGRGFFETTEGALLCSPNLLAESDPDRHEWLTLPDGDIGLRSPIGPIAEEFNATPMNDGSLYATYRTIDGHPAHAYSRDGGHNWSAPAFMCEAPGGRLLKNPRAANFVRRLSNGKYIYWFHHHGGKPLRESGNPRGDCYFARNPVWMCGGVERDGFIYWSQPEIILYDRNPSARISYPDFIEQDGRLFVTETQKTVARVHEIPWDLLDGMWAQVDGSSLSATFTDGLLADWNVQMPGAVTLPVLPDDADVTLELVVKPRRLRPWEALFDTRDGQGRGIVIRRTDDGALRLEICTTTRGEREPFASWSGMAGQFWDSDPLPDNDDPVHVAFVLDRRACVMIPVINGIACDGGETRQFGWGRLMAETGALRGSDQARLGEGVLNMKLYARALRISEVVAAARQTFA